MADIEEVKQKIMEFMEKKAAAKSKLYLKDMQRALPDYSPREIKKAANALVQEGKLEYFSTGSTVMYGIPGKGQAVE
ncbi:dissimilatory sulfite reductase D family protein [Thermosulfuriphilus sp.]